MVVLIWVLLTLSFPTFANDESIEEPVSTDTTELYLPFIAPINPNSATTTATISPSPTNTLVPTSLATPTQTLTPSPTATGTDLPLATVTPTETPSVMKSQTPTATPTHTPTVTKTATPIATPTTTLTPTPTATPFLVPCGEVSGIYRETSVWLSGCTYTISRTVQIAENVSLFIQPGVRVQFLNNRAVISTKNGRIIAKGTESEPIEFEGIGYELSEVQIYLESYHKSIFWWVRFSKLGGLDAYSSIEIDHCIFEETRGSGVRNALLIARTASVLNSRFINNENGLAVSSDSTPTVHYNLFTSNEVALAIGGLRTGASIQHNTITENLKGIALGGYYAINTGISNNNIFNNSGYNVVDAYGRSDEKKNYLRYNWWGTTDELVISDSILDIDDNVFLQEIVFTPILTSPDKTAPEAQAERQ